VRNNFLQEVRTAWKPSRLVALSCEKPKAENVLVFTGPNSSRIFLGRNAIMRKALGATVEEEYRGGCHLIAKVCLTRVVAQYKLFIKLLDGCRQELEGNVGLLFTDEEPKVVTDYFESYHPADYARSGNEAKETVILPEGT
jgi:mRNA turnover protein 4